MKMFNWSQTKFGAFIIVLLVTTRRGVLILYRFLQSKNWIVLVLSFYDSNRSIGEVLKYWRVLEKSLLV